MANIRAFLRDRKERERVILMYGPQKHPSIEEIDVELVRFDQEIAKNGLLPNEDERIRQLLLKTKELVKPVIEEQELAQTAPEVPTEPDTLSDKDILRILTNGTE